MSFIAYNEELIDTTIQANRQNEVRTVVVAIAVVTIVIVIALLIYFIIRYMMRRNLVENNGGNGDGGGGSIRCTSDTNCPSSSPACLVATGQCVQCRDNSQCSGTINKCNTTINSCVQCLATADCGECQECQNGACRTIVNPAAPTVTNATYLAFNTLRVDWTAVPQAINYLIEYVSPDGTGIPGVDYMLPQTVRGNITTYTVPPGQGACAPSGLGNVYVTAITPCGRSARSVAFRLQGQAC